MSLEEERRCLLASSATERALMRWPALALLTVVSSVRASTLQVPEQYPTIQAALNAGIAGDEISVAPGTYAEDVVFPVDGLTLRSRVRHAATIDGGGTGHVIVINNRTGTVDGFVITNSGGQFYSGIFTSQKSQYILNNLVTCNAGTGITISSYSIGWIQGNEIHCIGPTTNGIRAMTGARATILNNLVHGTHYAVWLSALSGGQRHYVLNNTIAGDEWGLIADVCAATVANNIITGADWGIYFLGRTYDPDLAGVVASYLSIHHNDVWGNGTDYFASLGGIPDMITGPFPPMPGTGEIGVDPLFLGDTNFRLQGGSPCIDAGDDGATSGEYDLDGNPRFVGTVDMGAYEYNPPTRVGDAPTRGGAGAQTTLHSPWMNPFETETHLHFSLASTTTTTLAVYDAAGHRVRLLLQRELGPGDHVVPWDGRNDAGGRVASGTYFVRLTTDTLVQVCKVVRLLN